MKAADIGERLGVWMAVREYVVLGVLMRSRSSAIRKVGVTAYNSRFSPPLGYDGEWRVLS